MRPTRAPAPPARCASSCWACARPRRPAGYVPCAQRPASRARLLVLRLLLRVALGLGVLPHAGARPAAAGRRRAGAVHRAGIQHVLLAAARVVALAVARAHQLPPARPRALPRAGAPLAPRAHLSGCRHSHRQRHRRQAPALLLTRHSTPARAGAASRPQSALSCWPGRRPAHDRLLCITQTQRILLAAVQGAARAVARGHASALRARARQRCTARSRAAQPRQTALRPGARCAPASRWARGGQSRW